MLFFLKMDRDLFIKFNDLVEYIFRNLTPYGIILKLNRESDKLLNNKIDYLRLTIVK